MPDYLAALDKNVRGLRIGVPVRGLRGRAATERSGPRWKASWTRSATAGRAIVEIALPHLQYMISAYYILMTAEASSNLARYDGARYGYRAPGARDLIESYVRSRSEGFGAETKRRIMLGTYVLSAGYYDAYYRKAQKVRRLIQNDFLDAFRSVDCVLMPTAPTTAFRIGEKIDDPLADVPLGRLYGVGEPCRDSGHQRPGRQRQPGTSHRRPVRREAVR